jgi:hypothetical protein
VNDYVTRDVHCKRGSKVNPYPVCWHGVNELETGTLRIERGNVSFPGPDRTIALVASKLSSTLARDISRSASILSPTSLQSIRLCHVSIVKEEEFVSLSTKLASVPGNGLILNHSLV